MTTVDVDDVLNDLKAALDVEPSAELVVRVRAAASRPIARAWWSLRMVAIGATAVVAMIAAVFTWPRAVHEVPDNQIQITGATSAEPEIQRPRAVRAPKTGSVQHQSSGVLIPPGEIDAMRALLSAIERGEFIVPPATPVNVDDEGHVKPLEIPFVVIEPLSLPKSGVEKGIGS
jgi:hypothetical protein